MIQEKIRPFIPTVCHCINDTGQGSIAALLPLFINLLGLSYYEAATVMLANTMCSSVVQPLFGYLADKVKLPFLIPLGVLMVTFSISFMGTTAGTYESVLLLALLSGIGSAIFHPEGALLVNRMTGPAKGKAMGFFAIGGNMGFAIGPIIASTAYTLGRQYLWIYAILGVICTLLYTWTFILSRSEEAEGVKKEAKEGAENDWKSFGKLFFLILARSVSFACLNTFIPLFWISQLGKTAGEGNMALTIFFTIGAILTYCGGALSDRVGYVHMIRYSLMILIPGLILFILSGTPILSYILMLPVAFGVFAMYGPTIVLGQTYLAKNVGFSSGITLGVGITIGGLMAPMVGKVGDMYGLQVGLATLIPIAVLALFVTFLLKENKKEE